MQAQKGNECSAGLSAQKYSTTYLLGIQDFCPSKSSNVWHSCAGRPHYVLCVVSRSWLPSPLPHGPLFKQGCPACGPYKGCKESWCSGSVQVLHGWGCFGVRNDSAGPGCEIVSFASLSSCDTVQSFRKRVEVLGNHLGWGRVSLAGPGSIHSGPQRRMRSSCWGGNRTNLSMLGIYLTCQCLAGR